MRGRPKRPPGRGFRPIAVVVVTVLGLAGAAVGHAARSGGAVSAAATSRQGCRGLPRLTGLTLTRARVLAARVGCRIRVAGAPILTPDGEQVQPAGAEGKRQIARQAPRPGGNRQSIDVWLVPACEQTQLPGPPRGEPLVRVGQTALVTGIYFEGGPLEIHAGPCAHGVPVSGTIAIIDPASGATVASTTVAATQLATIPLPPGTYTIEDVIPDPSATDPAYDPPVKLSPQAVTIPPGMTVRQDAIYPVP